MEGNDAYLPRLLENLNEAVYFKMSPYGVWQILLFVIFVVAVMALKNSQG